MIDLRFGVLVCSVVMADVVYGSFRFLLWVWLTGGIAGFCIVCLWFDFGMQFLAVLPLVCGGWVVLVVCLCEFAGFGCCLWLFICGLCC